MPEVFSFKLLTNVSLLMLKPRSTELCPWHNVKMNIQTCQKSFLSNCRPMSPCCFLSLVQLKASCKNEYTDMPEVFSFKMSTNVSMLMLKPRSTELCPCKNEYTGMPEVFSFKLSTNVSLLMLKPRSTELCPWHNVKMNIQTCQKSFLSNCRPMSPCWC